MTNFLQTIAGPLSGPGKAINRSKNPLWRLRRVFFAFFVFGVLAMFVAFAFYMQSELPVSAAELGQPSRLCFSTDEDCTPDNAIASAVAANSNREIMESIDEVAQSAIDALVATEDAGFYDHRGVNVMGTVRGVFQTVKAKVTGSGSSQGGSSITQQLVRNTYLTDVKTYSEDQASAIGRKPKEIVLAMKLERRMVSEALACKPEQTKNRCAKDEILLRYMNAVYYGRGVNGIKAASRSYFGKDTKDLLLEESAYLAGVLRNPTRANPVTYPEEARRRIDVTFDRMLQERYITQEEIEAANQRMEANLRGNPESKVALPQFEESTTQEGLGPVAQSEFGMEYVVDEIWQQFDELQGSPQRFNGGFKVYTTVDSKMQRDAYETVIANIPATETGPVGALVSIDPEGKVKALVGGNNFKENKFNFAVSRGSPGRQTGSLMKIMGLATALEHGFSANSLYTAPRNITFPSNYKGVSMGSPWRVKSSGFGDNTPKNYTDLRKATWSSMNSVYAQLVFDIRPEELMKTAKAMGITHDPGDARPSYILGANESSVIDMASAYSTIERDGNQIPPIMIERIEDHQGNVVCWYPARWENGEIACLSQADRKPIVSGQSVLKPETAKQMKSIMTGVVTQGTGKRASLASRPAAGKTGTTQTKRDAWFNGFTCGMTTAVWMGREDNKSLTSSGGGTPATIWGQYMKKVVPGLGPCDSIGGSSNYTGTVMNADLVSNLPACVGAVPVTPLPEQTPDQSATTTTTDPTSTSTTSSSSSTTSTTDPNVGENQQNALGRIRGAQLLARAQHAGALVVSRFSQQPVVQPGGQNRPPTPNEGGNCMIPSNKVDKRWIPANGVPQVGTPLPPAQNNNGVETPEPQGPIVNQPVPLPE